MNSRIFCYIVCFLIASSQAFSLPEEEVDISLGGEDNLWEDNDRLTRTDRLWRNWEDSPANKRLWPTQLVEKRLWRNWSQEDYDVSDEDEAVETEKRDVAWQKVKRLWKSKEISDSDTLCIPCEPNRCKRSSDKMRPQDGKTVPCCNC